MRQVGLRELKNHLSRYVRQVRAGRGASAFRRALARGELVVASDLTLVECDRILIRRQATGALSAADALRLRRSLAETAGHWNLMRIEREVVDRARSPFPGGPIRTRDALHLASAVVARAAGPGRS